MGGDLIVDVYVWETNVLPGRFSFAGHVMVAQHCGQVSYVNQYPHLPDGPSASEGINRFWSYQDTLAGAKSPPAAVYTVTLPDGEGFQREARYQTTGIRRWGAIPAVNSKTHTHCARAASQAMQAGGLPINSTFNQMDDGGQILPKTIHKILTHLAGVNRRNKSGEPHAW
jgi:hypothetical protein